MQTNALSMLHKRFTYVHLSFTYLTTFWLPFNKSLITCNFRCKQHLPVCYQHLFADNGGSTSIFKLVMSHCGLSQHTTTVHTIRYTAVP